MTLDQAIVLAIFGLALALFVWNRLRYDVVALIALLLAVLAGVVPADQAFLGFGDPAVIAVAAVLVISHAISTSAALDSVIKALSPWIDRPRFQVVLFVGLTTLASAVMNNIGAVALFLPLTMQAARRANRPASDLLMPIAFGSLLGGLITQIGTPPNLVISSLRADIVGEPFRMFDFTPVGLGVAAAGVAFLTVGWRLVPRQRQSQRLPEDRFNLTGYVAEVRLPDSSKAAGRTVAEFEGMVEGELTVLNIIRDDVRYLFPRSNAPLKTGDVLLLRTDPITLKKLVDATGAELAGSGSEAPIDVASDDIGVAEAVVMVDSPLVGRSPAELRLRSRYALNLLAIRRHGEPVRQRLGRTRFAEGDIVVFQGNRDTMDEKLAQLGCLPLAERRLLLGRPRRVMLPLGVLAGAVIATATGLLPLTIALLGAVLVLILLRVLRIDEAYDAINWPVIVLLGALIPVTEALQSTGGTELIAGLIYQAGAGLSPLSLLAVMLLATMLVTPVLNNVATVLVMAPIAASLAQQLGANVDTFLMAVAIGASCDFLTPIGHQSNTLVMGPGGYRFGDYWRLGLPLSIVVFATAMTLLPLVWPLAGA